MQWNTNRSFGISGLAVGLALALTACGTEDASTDDPVAASEDAASSTSSVVDATESDATESEATESEETAPDTSSESDSFAEPAEEVALPPGFPASFPTPEGGTVDSSTILDGGSSVLVTYGVPGDPVDVAAAVRTQLEGEGFTIDRYQERPDGATFVAALDADEFTVTIGGDLYDDAVAQVKVGYSAS